MRRFLAATVLLLTSQHSVSAQDAPADLVITVHPSGYEGRGETLDEKLARRERSFRFICLGCVRVDGRVDAATPFRPIDTLNAPQLSAALAAESRGAAEGGSPFDGGLPEIASARPVPAGRP